MEGRAWPRPAPDAVVSHHFGQQAFAQTTIGHAHPACREAAADRLEDRAAGEHEIGTVRPDAGIGSAGIEIEPDEPVLHRGDLLGAHPQPVDLATIVARQVEIDARRIIDLGAAPGGWSQIAARVTDSTNDHIRVAAIDFLEMDNIPGVHFVQSDFLEDDAPGKLMDALGGAPDLVISDMAAPTTGHQRTDHLRTMHLCEVAAHFAIDVLGEGGHFLAKTFQGGTEKELLNLLKHNFRQVVHVKPAASRSESVEMFILAKGFKGRKTGGTEAETEADPG